MNITRIKAPMYRIGRKQYNEYEVRHLMADVAERIVVLESPLKITQIDTKEVSFMRLDGILTDNLSGLKITGYHTLRCLKAQQIYQ